MSFTGRYGYFTFEQNNSGGYLLPGIPKIVIIEAASVDHAWRRAAEFGIDPRDGCREPQCCGPRWQAWQGTDVPSDWYDDPIEDDYPDDGLSHGTPSYVVIPR
jgi:hypothetical protein